MEAELRTPDARECEVCERRERWDDEAGVWRVADRGDPFCVHEWDINGSFAPYER